MKRLVRLALVVLAFLVAIPVKADPGILYVDDDGSADYSSIQEAIDAAAPYDTIIVRAGTYHEHLTVDKRLTLLGEDPNTTIIEGGGYGDVVHLEPGASWGSLSGFTIRNGETGVYMHVARFTVSNSIITGHSYAGLYVRDIAINNLVTHCLVSSNFVGVITVYESSIDIIENTIRDNMRGIIFMWYVYGSSPSQVYHNNLIDNVEQFWRHPITVDNEGIWDNGAGEGNYWSDYTGQDDGTGVGKLGEPRVAGDGIGDTNVPHFLDWYPLMEPVDWGVPEPINQTPIADAGGPYTVNEGDTVILNASGSSDPDGDNLLYEWDLDYDGATFGVDATGSSPTFDATSLDGPDSRTVALRVTDTYGASHTDTDIVTVNNVAPSASFGNMSGDLVEGELAVLAFSNQFDPSGPDTAAGWLYSYDCTDDGVFELSDASLASFTCNYPDGGTCVARGRVQDKDGDYNEYTVAVTVLSPESATDILQDDVQVLVDTGVLNPGQANGLTKPLENALRSLDKGKIDSARSQLQDFIGEVNLKIDDGVLAPVDGQPLIDMAERILASLD